MSVTMKEFSFSSSLAFSLCLSNCLFKSSNLLMKSTAFSLFFVYVDEFHCLVIANLYDTIENRI